MFILSSYPCHVLIKLMICDELNTVKDCCYLDSDGGAGPVAVVLETKGDLSESRFSDSLSARC